MSTIFSCKVLSTDLFCMEQASSAYNGIGVVKLMGRESGFIAMHATLASGQVDAVLIPEVIGYFVQINNFKLLYRAELLQVALPTLHRSPLKWKASTECCNL